MMHYGHMNAFRQGRALGTKLIVGVNSDETITACKGKPVNSDEERLEMVRGCKWVDEVVSGVPYIMNDEYLLYILEKYKIDYVVHGDDPCIVNGKDVYESAVKLGKYLTIPRTEGISTTDIVGRMLLMSQSHHTSSSTSKDDGADASSGPGRARSDSIDRLVSVQRREGDVLCDRKSNFLTTSRVIRLFGAGVKTPSATDRVVYLSGSWDMFHAGHVRLLELARSFGTHVIVGVHNDAVVNQIRGYNLPILNLQERVLSLLGCKWVDDVLIDAPFVLAADMIASLNIAAVVTARERPAAGVAAVEEADPQSQSLFPDPYAVAREQGILHVVETEPWALSVFGIVARIQAQRDRFIVKYNAKSKQEQEYYAAKYGNVL